MAEDRYALGRNRWKVTLWKQPKEKLPKLNLEVDVNGTQYKLSIWVNENRAAHGIYGQTGELIPFLRAIMGASTPKPVAEDQEPAMDPQPAPTNRKVDNLTKPPQVEDDGI